MIQQCFSILSMLERFNIVLTKTHHLEVNQTLSIRLFYFIGFLEREKDKGEFFYMTYQQNPSMAK